MIWAGPTVGRLCPSYDLRADCHAPCPTYTILGKLIYVYRDSLYKLVNRRQLNFSRAQKRMEI